MASGVNIQVTGIAKLQKKFQELPTNVATEIDAEMMASADDFVDRAVTDAPKDRGFLHQTISRKKEAVMHYEVVCSSEVAAYMEFGTRSRVVVPSDLESYAAQFRGPGKNQGDAKQAIYDWCKRQGIEEKNWHWIFMKIMTVGVNPHPFFFKQRQPVASALQAKIKPALKKAFK